MFLREVYFKLFFITLTLCGKVVPIVFQVGSCNFAHDGSNPYLELLHFQLSKEELVIMVAVPSSRIHLSNQWSTGQHHAKDF